MKSIPKYNRRQFSKMVSMLGFSSLMNVSAGADAGADAVARLPLFTGYGVCTRLAEFGRYGDVGYDYLEDSTSSLLMPHLSDRKFEDKLGVLRGANVKALACNGFLPRWLRCVGDDANHVGVLAYADIVFKRARLAGIRGIVFGSASSRKLRDGCSRRLAEGQFVALLKRMAPLAGAQGVEIWLEPLNRDEDNFLNTQAQGAAILEKVNHPALGMVCDIFHVVRNGESPDDVLKTVEYVRHCHIAEKVGRSAPGTRGDDFSGYLMALRKGGYSGLISMECGWDKNEDRPKLALDYLRKQVISTQS